jgi:hypothetical protein
MTDCANGTWDFTNGIGLQIRWVIAAGSNYNNGTESTWGTTGLYGVSGQVNGLDSTDNDFYLTGVQLEKGSVATPFEFRPYETELALCQRYCLRYGGVATYEPVGVGGVIISTQARIIVHCPVEMRTTPTLYTTDSALWHVMDGGSYFTSNGLSLGAESSGKVLDIVVSVASGLTGGDSAILRANNSTSAYLVLSAEL